MPLTQADAVDEVPAQRPQFTLWQLLGLVALFGVALAIGLPLMRWLVAQQDATILLPTFTAVVVVVPGLVIGLGMTPLHSRCTKTATLAEAFSHGIGLLGLVVVNYGVVPGFGRVFREFDVELPKLTQVLLAVSETALRHPELAMLAVVILILVDIVVFAALHQATVRRPWARAWSACVTLLLLAAMVVSPVALISPLLVITTRLTG